jgi:membrane-associated protease RseP (regulator of RpoE activity)
MGLRFRIVGWHVNGACGYGGAALTLGVKMMTRFLATLVVFLGFAGATFQSAADVPPPYTLYGIGATMEDGEPFPKIKQVNKGGPAALAGVKAGDQVLALNGTYSGTPAPFYFFARGLQGPKDSMAELILLRNEAQVLVVKVKRTVRS